MLFRGKAVEKRVPVLSGGERARLCLAGLLLGSFNILILDEPGNHLDVETVDALAQALLDYRGTVIFTSHDRSFVETVATNVVEVGNGRVINYGGSYKQYLAAMNSEIDAEEAAAGGGKPAPSKKSGGGGKPAGKPGSVKPDGASRAGNDAKSGRDVRREIGTLERSIAKLDAEKRAANEAMLATTDPAEALRHHTAMTTAAEKLAAAEERWLELQEQAGAE